MAVKFFSIRFFYLFLLLIPHAPGAYASSQPLQNQLADNPSAYLALHGHDPVAWQVWNEQSLQRARQENKLIFVSIGYFSCHWCHVMQRESYSDKAVAAILNQHYIAIKVDRELLPALDARLIDFVERTRGSAGWPLNVILTPDAYPLVGTTYEPKARFVQLLQQVQQKWHNNQDYLHRSALAAAQALNQELASGLKKNPRNIATDKLWQVASKLYVQQAMTQADTLLGGFGQQAKFPMVSHLQALLDIHALQNNPDVEEFLVLTLEQMASQNLRDILGGGFFRYTVDPDWQTPHFEKMLYDNAALAALYLRAGRILRRDDFKLIAYQTLDFMVHQMQLSGTGMIASFSAVDDKNVEGGYYLWQAEQLRSVMSEQRFRIVQALWRLDQASAFEAGYLPRIAKGYDEVAKQLKLPLQKVVDESVAISKLLLAQRQRRVLPSDNKRLAAWNGMALSSLSLALQDLKAHGVKPTQLRYRQYQKAAQGIRDYILNTLLQHGGLLRARSSHQQAMGQAGLEDYAFVAEGLWLWSSIGEDKAAAQLAQQLVDQAWQGFYSESGWQQSAKNLLPLSIGVAAIADGALPSPSASLMRITHELRAGQLDNSKSALQLAQNLLQTEPFNYPGLVSYLARVVAHKP